LREHAATRLLAAALGSYAALSAFLNRGVLLRHAPVILVMALAGFGASVAADILDRILILPIVVEDGAKLIGICNWVAVGATLLAAGVRPSDEA
jgi:hypothetical protein